MMDINRKARALADRLIENIEGNINLLDEEASVTIPGAEEMILAFAVEVRRDALQHVLELIVSEDMYDETDDPTDAAYSRAIQDCVDVVKALIDAPPSDAPDRVVALAEVARTARAVLFHSYAPEAGPAEADALHELRAALAAFDNLANAK